MSPESHVERFQSLLEEALELVPSICQIEWENGGHRLMQEIEIYFNQRNDLQPLYLHQLQYCLLIPVFSCPIFLHRVDII